MQKPGRGAAADKAHKPKAAERTPPVEVAPQPRPRGSTRGGLEWHALVPGRVQPGSLDPIEDPDNASQLAAALTAAAAQQQVGGMRQCTFSALGTHLHAMAFAYTQQVGGSVLCVRTQRPCSCSLFLPLFLPPLLHVNACATLAAAARQWRWQSSAGITVNDDGGPAC